MSEIDWEDLLQAYLHDPFDKALAVQGHESRAARYASAALGRQVARRHLHRLAARADVAAAIAERLPLPTAGTDGVRAVGPDDGLCIVHPASADRALLSLHSPDPDKAVAAIEEIVQGLPGPRERFFAIWRLLPDRIAADFGQDMARLPADTRIPDHTLFQHTDITAGLYAAGAPDDAAYLSFALGSVQTFIKAARSVRDLWSGSALLSWLAFQAMKPILEQLGPTAFVYPALRGGPLMDLWLRRDARIGDRVPMPSRRARMAPSLPHRFVAVVPWGADGSEALVLRQACLDSACSGWSRLALAVRNKLLPQFASFHRDWARLWDSQVQDSLEFRAAVTPARELSDDRLAALVGTKDFSSTWHDAQKVRNLATAIPCDHRPQYDQDTAGRWQAQMEMSARLIAATRAVRHVPETSAPSTGPSPGKCTLFGSWEQMGPTPLRASQAFWQRAAVDVSVEGVRIRSGERLCAVALTKRFAGPALLASELELNARDMRFPDTATVAAREWLSKVGIDYDQGRGHWSGLWLHWRQRHENQDEEEVPSNLWNRICSARKHYGWPPAYYAVLAMDGDEMGRWLAGQKTPQLRELLHPKLRSYFEALDDPRAEEGLSARRPVGPALHAAISSALATFAAAVAPKIVEEHHGTMIYSGGDDVLALSPVATAFDCASALRDAFSGRDDPAGDGWRKCGERRQITMGNRASLRAGLAVVHFREDLRVALEAARAAEANAKKAGGDVLVLATMRRSGEATSAVCPWPRVRWLDDLRERFAAGVSDAWTYRLRAELPALASDLLPPPAVEAEIRRLVDRGDGGGDGADCRGAAVADAFRCHSDSRAGNARGDLLREFVTLVQSAAFMARGHDG